jgi:hypothetical protein
VVAAVHEAQVEVVWAVVEVEEVPLVEVDEVVAEALVAAHEVVRKSSWNPIDMLVPVTPMTCLTRRGVHRPRKGRRACDEEYRAGRVGIQ